MIKLVLPKEREQKLWYRPQHICILLFVKINRKPSQGANSYKGLGIHLPAKVISEFVIFCPGYWSCFVNLALVMGLLCRDLPYLCVNVSNF